MFSIPGDVPFSVVALSTSSLSTGGSTGSLLSSGCFRQRWSSHLDNQYSNTFYEKVIVVFGD